MAINECKVITRIVFAGFFFILIWPKANLMAASQYNNISHHNYLQTCIIIVCRSMRKDQRIWSEENIWRVMPRPGKIARMEPCLKFYLSVWNIDFPTKNSSDEKKIMTKLIQPMTRMKQICKKKNTNPCINPISVISKHTNDTMYYAYKQLYTVHATM